MTKKLLTLFTLLTLSIGVGWAETNVTFIAGDDVSNTLSITKKGITITLSNGTLSRDDNYRLYGTSGANMTIEATSATITKVEITCSSKEYGPSYLVLDDESTGSYTFEEDGTVGTWIGSAQRIQLNGGTKQVRMKSIVVTYDTGGATTHSITGIGATTGGMVTADPSSGITAGTSVTITATPVNGYEFVSLTVDGNTVTTNPYIFNMPSHDVAVSATFSAISQGNVEWVLTDPSDLATGDVVLIVDKTSSKALANDKGTSSAPSATDVTLNPDKYKVEAGANANLQWIVTKNNGTFNFDVPESAEFLYCTKANNGVRVSSSLPNSGTKDFTITNSTTNWPEDGDTSDFLTCSKEDWNENRYVGVYDNQDWRCYNTTTNNIKSTEIAFYKRVQTGAHSITVDNTIVHGTVVTDELSGNQDDEITITVTPETGYELTALDYNRTPITPTTPGNAVSTYTFTMPDADVTIHATFSLINYTISIDNSISGGSITTTPSGSATMGQEVTVNVNPADGKKLLTLSYTVEGGTNAVTINETNGAYKFEMPAANVTITATFIEDKALYILGMINGAGGQPHQAVKMNYDGTKYTANIWVIGNSDNALGVPGSWFAFTQVVAENNDGWNYVNGYRFEPDANDANYVLNGTTATPVTLYKRYYNKSFLIRSGLYRVTVTPTNNDDGWTFSLDEIKNLTPSISPESGNVVLNSKSTVSIGEDFNTFISSCNPVVDAWGQTVSITPPVAKFYVNNELVNGTSKEITLDEVGEITVTGECALYVNGNDKYAAKSASETYNVYRTYSATIANGTTGGTVAFNAGGTTTTLNNLPEGHEVRVYVTPNEGFALESLTYTVEGSSDAENITNNAGDYYTFNMPNGNVTIDATFTGVVTERTYALTNVLEEGTKYLIVYTNGNNSQALGGSQDEAYDVVISTNNQITVRSDSQVSQLTLGGSTDAWTFQKATGYLYAGSSTQSVNQTGSANNNDNIKWTISFDTDKNVTLKNNGSNRLLRYYDSNDGGDFRAYTSTSYGENIQLYKEVTTLAWIEKNGTQGKSYTVADDLQIVAVSTANDRTVVFARDLAESNHPATCPLENATGAANDPIDFMRYGKIKGDNPQANAWQQNNWVMLNFGGTGLPSTLNLKNNINIIEGGTLKGVYADDENYTINVTNGTEIQCVDGTAHEFTPNVYCPANFHSSNTQPISLTTEDGTVTKYYWFMTPKPMEVFELTWALWYNSKDQNTVSGYDAGFYMQTGTADEPGPVGGVGADMSYNSTEANLVSGASYRFISVAMTGPAPQTRAGSTIAPNPQTMYPQAGSTLNSDYHIAAVDLDTSAGSDNIITGVSEVKTGSEVVSVTYCDLAGRMSQKPFAGVNIIVTRYSDGTVKTTKAIK